MKKIFNNVPQSLEKHIFFDSKGKGYCESLNGDVLITVIFLDDAESHWTDETREKAKEKIMSGLRDLLKEAKSYGATLNLSLLYKNSKVNHNVHDRRYKDVWCNEALKNAGLSGIEETNLQLEKTYNVKDAPFIFALNKPGRAYACPTVYEKGSEYALVYEDVTSINHELLHCFGAKDLYYPGEIYTLAKEYLTGSIMYMHGGTVDSLTAYLIGWTNTLSSEALEFLTKTSYLTYEKINEALKKETQSGFVTKVMESGTYTGYMDDGVIDGKGKMVFNDGSTYDGFWKYGSQHGHGTMNWSNGVKYTGEWINGERTGQGKITYVDGGTYEGTFEKGTYHGHGKQTWKDGSVYTGNWTNGKMNGSGTMVWADGTKYVGDWKDGNPHGYGTMTWKSGTVQTGRFENGNYVGK